MEQELVKTFWVIAPGSVITCVSGKLEEYNGGWYPYDAFQDENGKWWFDWFETKAEATAKAKLHLQIELDELEAKYQEKKAKLLVRKERLGM